MKIPKLFLASILISALFLVFSAALPVRAQSSIDDMIKSLQQQIAQIMAQIKALQEQKGQGQTWCHTFNANIGMGQKTGNPEIEALATVLQKEGLLDQGATFEGYDENLASAVTGFQEKYASEILTPSNLKHGTGYVGKATRAKLNALYGCNIACTQEAKQCPDGSYVSRTGPNCEFAPCPTAQCKTDNDCPQPTCSAPVGTYAPTCIAQPVKCVDGKCVPSNALQEKESVKCIFNNNTTNTEQKCYTADEGQSRFSCSGTFSCVMDVYGKKGEQLTWKSSCGGSGGLAYTTMDGQNEYAQFDCSSTQPFVTVVSPNGGETYKNNGSIIVNWKTAGVSASQILDVIRLRVYPNGQEYNLISNTLNDGIENIAIPSSVPVGAYTLEIKSYVNNILVFDASDSYFKIVSTISQCSSDADCPTMCPTCVLGTGFTCQPCAKYKCVEGKCVVFEQTPTIKEQVKCLFASAKDAQKCYSDDGFGCSGIEACVADVYGEKGKTQTWKSSCGGYAYTTIDGNNEYAKFDCSSATCTPNWQCILGPCVNGSQSYVATDTNNCGVTTNVTSCPALVQTCTTQPLIVSSSYLIGNQSTYTAGQTIKFSVKGVVSDGNAGTPSKGFHVQSWMQKTNPIETVQINGAYQSVNADYNLSTGYWDVTMTAPSDTAQKYIIDTAFYCSNPQLGCSKEQINKSFEFTISSSPLGLNTQNQSLASISDAVKRIAEQIKSLLGQ